MVAIPQNFKETVVFIYVKDIRGNWVPSGTGFWVAQPDKKDPNASWIYLVTAKHVLSGDEILVRFSSENPQDGPKNISHSLRSNPVFTHPTNTAVDVAVLPFPPSHLKEFGVKSRWLGRSIFATKDVRKKEEIGEGDDIFFIGLFTHVIGKKQNTPVVRHGKIALLTEEPFEFDGGAAELIYVEANSFGGNSGGPVYLRRTGFVRQGAKLNLMGDKLWLLGIMAGHFLNPMQIKPVETKVELTGNENMGIAIVFPVDYLAEILDSPEAKRFRGEE